VTGQPSGGQATSRETRLASFPETARRFTRSIWTKANGSLHYFSELRWVFLVGILIRFALWVYSSQADLSGFASQSVTMLYGGGPYTYGNNYPPSWPFLLNLVGHTATIWAPPSEFLRTTSINAILVPRIDTLEPAALVTPLYSIVEKSFLLPFDVGVGLIIYYLTKSVSESRLAPRVAFAVWFLNPFVITVSSIHGNYDVISTFFVLVGLLLIMKGDPLVAGVSVGIAATLELYPLFLVPIFIALIVRAQRPVAALQRTGWFLAGGAIAGVVVLWPPSLLGQFITSFSTGPQLGQQFGGFWIWSLVSIPLPVFRQLSHFLTAHSIVVEVAGALTAIFLVTYFAVRWVKAPQFRSDTTALSYTMISSILAVYFVLPIVEPQNLIWLLPFLVLGWVGTKSLRLPLVAVSVLPVLFDLVALGGPLYFFQGLAVFTNVVSPQTVVSSITQFASYQYISFPLTLVPTFSFLVLAFIHSVRLRRAEIVEA
jgi:hypothetical protein